MYSVLIKNVNVIDGTGKPGQVFDVAIEGDKIVNIDKTIPSKALNIIDGTGLVLAPGFIDLQNHSDSYWQIFDNPNFDSLISQGFTSILVGNCGASLAPLLSPSSLLAMQKWHNLEGVNINWQHFSEFTEHLSKTGFGCNIGSLVGYGTIRRGVVEDQVRSLDKPELKAIIKILEQSLEAGAFGLSSGLSYSHEIIVSELELFELAKVIKKHDGLLAMHLRSESADILESLEEAIDIARNTEVNLKISHLKLSGPNNWHKFSQLVSDLEIAYHQGTNLAFDIYPYDTIWQPLFAYLPKWAIEGGRKTLLHNLSNPMQLKKILLSLNSLDVKFPELIISSTANKLSAVGKKLGLIAKNLECSSEQAVIHLIERGGSEVLVFEKSLNEEQVRELLFHPLAVVSTDGAGFDLNHKDKLVHPRCFGTAPRFIKLAKGLKLPLENAIKKLTSLPAKLAGIKKRGEIKIDNFADLVLFDPEKISDKATYENPYQLASGIEYVFVNGKPVLENGQINGKLPGRVLRK